ncbi:MAG: hypothetical protein JRI25_24070 [Deltaproteobacteria bacterium]|nr:hypothetical protein [Deltaproteobacteria bacterium]
MRHLAPLPVLLLLAGAPAWASSQLYLGLGMAWTPKAEHPMGLLVEGSWRFRPGEARDGLEIGPFLQLRAPGLKVLEGSTGLVAAYSGMRTSDSHHAAYVQLDGELGLGVVDGQVAGHLGASAAKNFTPYFSDTCREFPCTRTHFPSDPLYLRLRGRMSLRPDRVLGSFDAGLQVWTLSQTWFH